MVNSNDRRSIPNCWEFKNCNKGPESKNRCIATKYRAADGFLCGDNGGHACMFIANTKCGNEIFMTIPQKIMQLCSNCEFYKALEDRYGYLSFVEFLDFRSRNIPPDQIDY